MSRHYAVPDNGEEPFQVSLKGEREARRHGFASGKGRLIVEAVSPEEARTIAELHRRDRFTRAAFRFKRGVCVCYADLAAMSN